MLQERGGLIIRQLCLCLGPKQVFLQMAELLEGDETDLDFAEAMTDKLSLILLTAPEANQLRQVSFVTFLAPRAYHHPHLVQHHTRI
jgi:hypothetical protein